MTYRVLLAALAAALCVGPAAGQISTSVVAATGQSAPGGGTYTTFGGQGPSLNAAGQVAFVAGLSGNSTGVFRITNGTSELIARQGQPVPDAGDTYAGFSLSADGDRAALRDDGDLVFSASLQGGGPALLRSVGGSTSLATLTEVPAAGLSGVTVTTLYPGSARLSVGDRVFTYVDLSGTPDQAIYEVNGTALTLVAAAGLAAPGGGTFTEIPTEFTVNAAGQLAFASNLSGGGGGVFRYQPGVGTVAIARNGTVAPGGAGTVAAVEFSVPAVNAAGQVAFVAGLTGGTSNAGVFRGGGGGLTNIALEGQVAPDTGGRRFSQFDLFLFPDAVRGNAGGDVLFLAGLTGDSFGNTGLFRGNGTGVALIAQRGEVAPGAGGVARFASFTTGGLGVGLADGGRVVFRATVEGVGVTAANDTGLWTGTGFGDLQLIAREGDMLTVNGQSRTLAGLPTAFELTADGVAWRAVFTDNTQAIVYTSFAPVPEPAGLLAAAAAAVAGLAAVRRRAVRAAQAAPWVTG